VVVRRGEFTARSFEELFQQTKALPWEEWLPVDARFPVTGKSVKSQLYSVPDCQAIVKKAIVERLKDTYG
jgi:putative N6-adenine-specific DNA methylase